MRKIPHIVAVSAAITAIAVGSPPAFAQSTPQTLQSSSVTGVVTPPQPGAKGIGGILESINGSSLVVKTRSGKVVTITINGSTTYHSGSQSISESALTTGKELHVRLTSSGNASSSSTSTRSTLVAADVSLVPPHWDGAITTISGNTLTLKTANGTFRVDKSASTKVDFGPPAASSSSSSLATGMIVHVEGSLSGSTIDATTIQVGGPQGGLKGGPKGGPNGLEGPLNLIGTIESLSGNNLVVKTPQGHSVTFELTSSTTYHNGAQSVSESSLAIGKEVHIRLVNASSSTRSSNSASSSTSSQLRVAADVSLVPPHWNGAITTISGNTLTLKTANGTFRVDKSASTKVDFGPPAASSSSSSLATDMLVQVEGSLSGSTINATTIHVAPTPPTKP
ncbi:MAG: DUF5666 domain-containing protein [Bacilli bacterium]